MNHVHRDGHPCPCTECRCLADGLVREWKPAMGHAPAGWWWVRPTPGVRPMINDPRSDDWEAYYWLSYFISEEFRATGRPTPVIEPGLSFLTNTQRHLNANMRAWTDTDDTWAAIPEGV